MKEKDPHKELWMKQRSYFYIGGGEGEWSAVPELQVAFIFSEVNLHLPQILFKSKVYSDLWIKMLESWSVLNFQTVLSDYPSWPDFQNPLKIDLVFLFLFFFLHWTDIWKTWIIPFKEIIADGRWKSLHLGEVIWYKWTSSQVFPENVPPWSKSLLYQKGDLLTICCKGQSVLQTYLLFLYRSSYWRATNWPSMWVMEFAI